MIGLRKVYKIPLSKIYKNPNMFVKLIDIMPRVSEDTDSSLNINCDAAIAEAARVSYGKGTKTVNEDKDLIKYLVRHKHTSPFEMVEFKFHLAMPIFIQRQWIRHRTANVNEISGRYSEFDHNFYHPKVLLGQSKLNKQVSCDVLENSTENLDKMKEHSNKSFGLYKELLEAGVSREIARTVLPQNLITEFYWKIDLHNLLHFIRLRDHPHAQTEIRQYAGDIKHMVKKFCPVSVKAYDNHFVKGVHLSGEEVELIKKKSENGLIIQDMSKGEQREFKTKLKKLGLS
jgi:thymidylate synthase (FAD)